MGVYYTFCDTLAKENALGTIVFIVVVIVLIFTGAAIVSGILGLLLGVLISYMKRYVKHPHAQYLVVSNCQP